MDNKKKKGNFLYSREIETVNRTRGDGDNHYSIGPSQNKGPTEPTKDQYKFKTSVRKISLYPIENRGSKNITDNQQDKSKMSVQKIFNKSCIFPNCLYKGTTGLYKFPISDKNRLDLWLNVCKLSSVRPHEAICKNHFHPNDFSYGRSRTLLKKSAVPHWNNSVS